jgi:hypothetical protein
MVALREPGVPYAELPTLRRPILRTTAFRIVLGLALSGVALAALAIALSRDAQPDPLLPAGTTGMIVIDLSASAGLHPEIGQLFRRVAAANEPTGLIAFSDVPYELVPPGTPGRDLAPMIRFFTPTEGGGTPSNPWSATFQAGTRISAGLEAGYEALRREGIERGSILLVSDLEFFQDDLGHLTTVIAQFRREGVELRIIPLAARDAPRRFFERVAGIEAFVELESEFVSSGTQTFRLAEEGMPWLFVGLAFALAALLAVNERLCGRLKLGRQP